MFTHLQVASGYSARYGASLPDALVAAAAQQDLTALALTDRDTVAGTVRFAKAAMKAGIRPLFGVDLALARTEPAASTTGPRRSPARGGAFVDESAPRVTFLARDRSGWAAISRMISAAHADPAARRPLLTWSALRQYAGPGLTVLLGPDSEPLRALSTGRPDRATELLAPWREAFGDQLRLAAVAHRQGDTGPGSLRLAARTVGLAADLGIEAVLSNAVRYAHPAQAPIADVLDAARRLVPMHEQSRDPGERWLKPAAAMQQIAERIAQAAGQEHGGAARLLAATQDTAAGCRLDPHADLGIGQVFLPEDNLIGADVRPAHRVLASRCVRGMVLRGYHHDGPTWRRLDHELDIIGQLGFESYFLAIGSVVDDARAAGIRAAARGSGAGSLVVHLLGIAAANPMDHGLLMERFLSPHRRTLPDIDVDVESARRIEVYRQIFDRFGAERTCAIAMPETYRVRHAIRDAGAALGMDPDEIGRLAKAFPHIRAKDARSALAELPELRETARHADKYRRLWDLVEGLDALPRGIAMHPCGVVISDAGLLDRTPVVPTSGEGLPMSQFDKEDVEDLGLIKLDVLGVRLQSAMAHAVVEIQRTTGKKIDLDSPRDVPPGDQAAYELIRSSETLGCFQIESPGQRELIGRLQPETFEDLVIDISLFRPGPVAADMITPFIDARHGKRTPVYPHPDLVPALEGTLGVVVFNEQVMQIVATMTGCDLGWADVTRRALGDPQRIPKVEAWFRTLALARGYTEQVVGEVWDILAAMASYGFAKAHATAFAVPTYQSSWLKAHHPAAFYAGVLTHDPGMYPKRLIVADARRFGVPILPVDVQKSAADYRTEPVDTPDGPTLGLRLALSDVHGISEEQTARMVDGQPYASLADWFTRARPSLPVAERLARIGALESLGRGTHRRDLLLQITELHRQHQATAIPTQLALADTSSAPAPSGLPVMTAQEELGAELAVLGLDGSRHLMSDHHQLLAELGAVPAHRLADLKTGEQVLVAGAKVANQTPPNKTGKRILFATLDDGTGLVDLAFFDDAQHCAGTVFHSFLLLVRGTIARRGPRSLSVVGNQAWNLADLAAARESGGLDAVLRLLATTATHPMPAPDTDRATAPDRVITLPTGYTLAPWADLQPAGDDATATPETVDVLTWQRRMNGRSVAYAHFHAASDEAYRQIFDSLADITPVVQALPSDAALLDLTGATRYFHATPAGLALLLQVKVMAKFGITTTVGIAENRLLATLAAQTATPGTIRTLPREPQQIAAFLDPLPIRAVPDIGPKTAKTLAQYGLHTIADLRPVPLATLQRITTATTGRLLAERSRGTDPRTVQPQGPPTSMSATRHFSRDTLNPTTARSALLSIALELGTRLRHTAQVTGRLELEVRLADRSSTTRARTLREPTDHTRALHHTLTDLNDSLALQRARLRSVTVRAQQLRSVEDSSVQLTFDRRTELQRRLDPLLDRANARFGADALHFAALLGDPHSNQDAA